MKLGLCLSGGGIKGAAHIGVLKAFEEEKIKIDYISGTSSGSIVASLYAMGYSADKILEIFKKYSSSIKYFEYKNILYLILGIIFKRKIIIKGLNSGNKIEKIMMKACEEKNIYNINEINIPLIIPSVNLANGEIYCFCSKNIRNTFSDETVYINDADICKVVRASCSYPVIFEPCKYNGINLIDGGVRENIPWKYTKQLGADKVISIVFKEIINNKEITNFFDVATKSLEILGHELSNYELYGADYLIKIKSEKIALLDKSKINYLYNIGYDETKKVINNIKKEIK